MTSGIPETCCGCGAAYHGLEGPAHAYMQSAPACFAAFGELLAAEYSSAQLMKQAHRLTVDTWAVQHPGDAGDRRAVQSVGLHLARLHVQLEQTRSAEEKTVMMREFTRSKASLQPLPPPARFRITVATVAPFAGTRSHAEKVREWAESTWHDWSDHHAHIRRWVAECASRR